MVPGLQGPRELDFYFFHIFRQHSAFKKDRVAERLLSAYGGSRGAEPPSKAQNAKRFVLRAQRAFRAGLGG